MTNSPSRLVGKVALAPVLAAMLVIGYSAPLSADRRSEARAQVDFGIDLAQKDLWREAEARWIKATEIDPTYSAAWNNLGIAYEQQGKFPEARKAYEKARELDPKNTYIQQNFDMFMEIYERQNRRRSG